MSNINPLLEGVCDYKTLRAYAQEIITDATSRLEDLLPRTVRALYEDGGWKEDFPNFCQFVEGAPPKGLNVAWQNLAQWCIRHHDCREMLALGGPTLNEHGVKKVDRGDIITSFSGGDNITPNKRGTSRDYLLSRLGRDSETKPEIKKILDDFIEGSIKSVKVASELAGYRQPTVTVFKTPVSFARKIDELFGEEGWQEIARWRHENEGSHE